jgi:Domain of unknown function (DUF397)
MAAQSQDLSRAEWLKSTRSSQDGNCVEVSANLPDLVAVRDSKHRDGPVLTFGRSEWRAFLGSIRDEDNDAASAR